MDPITHALASAALDRAGLNRLSRRSLLILVIAGIAPDLDLASYFFGARAYMRFHHAVLHSLIGGAALAFLLAAIFFLIFRRKPAAKLHFWPVLLLCGIGIGAHIALDVTTIDGASLFWPFCTRWFSRDFAPGIDPWILTILAAGIFIPWLFKLINEEIGERQRRRASRGAIAALIVLTIYLGARAAWHHQAVTMLLSADYHGAAPLAAGAFPDSSSPLFWRGVVDTEKTVEQVSVPVGIAGAFDPDSSLTFYKPQGSDLLAPVLRTRLAQQFLHYAQFPLANIDSTPSGSRTTLHDMRFAGDSTSPANILAIFHLDASGRVVRDALAYDKHNIEAAP